MKIRKANPNTTLCGTGAVFSRGVVKPFSLWLKLRFDW